MMENEIKKQLRKFRGLEIAMDNIRLDDMLLPPDQDLTQTEDFSNLEYFKKYGFKVSSIFSKIYERYNGIKSDKYIPASLYFYYINPYLLNMNLSMAYVDKNSYSNLFPEIKTPITIIKNINGRFYSAFGEEMNASQAVEEILRHNKFIIKPSIESGRGRDVKLVNNDKGDIPIEELFKIYESDFIVQEIVKQSKELNKLNPTSLNTCRLYSFRPVNSMDYVVLGAAVRFGGQGSHVDNLCAGGGLCKIEEDGTISDRIYQYCNWTPRYLSEERGLKNLVFPSFDKVRETCLSLHRRLPYMDLIGWDIAVDENGDVILIELNQYPDCELLQMFNGPMFGEYTDDLLEAISKNETKIISVAKRIFPNLSSHHDYNFEIGKQYTI